ncbi:MAG: DEAD/DEAH box helicase [Deltaproteobacteria bacterium]|nr:DEAD/DEAH box helicase [Deltaproteobacteria bacterium]
MLYVRLEELIDVASGDEVSTPVLALSFTGGVFEPTAEAEARRLLERFGAVEIACLEYLEVPYGSNAEYVVDVDGSAHGYCAFSAYALPQLRSLGWQVEVDADYPYRVVEADVPWYVDVSADTERPDWFNLELGIALDGVRVSLLPALLALLDRLPEEGDLAGLLRMATRLAALPLGDGRYLPVPPDRLRRVLAIVRDLYEGVGITTRAGVPVLRLDARLAATAFELGAVLEEGGRAVAWTGATELRELGEALSSPPPTDAVRARGLQAELRPYQREGVAWLQHLATHGLGGVLADDMGLGKTLQTIAHLLIEKESGRLRRPALLVAPTSLVPGWAREIAKFAPRLEVLELQGSRRRERFVEVGEADVVVTSYPLLWRDIEMFEEHEFHIVVLDEAQAIKNLHGKAASAVRALRADLRLCLSGTPLENNLGELHAMFDFLLPGLLGSREAFQIGFRQPIEAGDEERLELLRRRVAPFILRRLKRDVARDLPPKTELVRPIDLSEEERELYESIRIAAHAEVRSAIRKKGLAASTVPVLDALMKLRQVCCHPRLVKVPAAAEVPHAAKFDTLLELCRTLVAEGRRVLVFSQFTRMLTLVSEALLAEGIRHVTLTGATTDRQAKIDAFQEGRADVFLISLKAGGTGLTLTAADTVIHYDPWWNPAAQSQATDRAYRIGQTKPVFVYRLIVAGSVEERMLGLQQRKQALADAILGGGVASTALTEADVDDLFAPLE